MATVKMKLLTVTGEEQFFQRALELCTSAPAFHIENAHDIIGAAKSYNAGGINRYSSLISQLDSFALSMNLDIDITPPAPDKPGADKNKIEIPADSEVLYPFSRLIDAVSAVSAANEDDIAGAVSEAVEMCRRKFNELSEERDTLSGEIRDNERVIEQLNHMKDIGTHLEDLFSFEFFRFRFGHMPKSNYEALRHYERDLDDVFFFESSTENDEVWGLYFTPTSKSPRIDNLFRFLSFERIRISDKAHGTPSEAKKALSTEIDIAAAKISEITANIDKMKEAAAPVLAYIMREIRAREKYAELRSYVAFVKKTFCIAGWIPEKNAEQVKEKLEEIPSVSCVTEAPVLSGQTPPTMLKNPKFLKPFEEFVNMYGLPSTGELDPTLIVAITYFIFFGLMFGDLGQGILLITAGLLIYFVGKMWLGGVIAACGVSSAIFGTFYGSVFGLENIINGFNPMENINTTLIAAVGIGIVMIIMCMILNIINGIRQKDIKKVFFSPNGVAGLLMYVSAVIIVLGMVGMVKSLMPTNILIAVILIMLLLIFSAEPLCGLIKRRPDWMPESKLDFILENFFELIEVVLSYLTNTISFIRIGAFALSHVGMMTVIFLLAGGENGNIAVIIIGNLFVTGFEGLIVGIQVLRLEFYELFGRFYTGDGRPFENSASRK